MVSKKKRHVKEHPSYNHYKIMAAVLGILLLISVFTNGFTSVSPERENLLIFLKPIVCRQQCNLAEETLKQFAENNDFDFSVARHEKEHPGYVMVYNSSALVSAFVDKRLFNNQVCGFTGLEEACEARSTQLV